MAKRIVILGAGERAVREQQFWLRNKVLIHLFQTCL